MKKFGISCPIRKANHTDVWQKQRRNTVHTQTTLSKVLQAGKVLRTDITYFKRIETANVLTFQRLKTLNQTKF